MILFLCYVFPPAAVFLMGRPFSSMLNFLLTSCLWVPGVKHALACYADYKVDGVTRKVTNAVHNPQWSRADDERSLARVRRKGSGQVHVETVVIYDNPHVGKNGTYFRPKN
jgi:uncharacterized membrane protein YqaE (UPF0057 family)